MIDLGPEAGARGGQGVAMGPPEAVAVASGSLTGPILKAVLAAGPHADRPRFDPKAAAKKIIAEIRAASDAEQTLAAKSPWEVDGRRWHTRDRVGRSGRPARWEGRILERIVDRIHELDEFSPTDWSGRAVVKIAGPEPGASPFFQASTGNEWVVTLRFHVSRNTFRKATLAGSLALTPFHESPTPVLCDHDRLSVANGKGVTQEVTITCHAAADVETPEFEAFLARAVASYRRSGKTGALVAASELR